MKTDEIAARIQLQTQFVNKIIEEWPATYSTHQPVFNGFDQIVSRNAFVQHVADEVEVFLTHKHGLVEGRRMAPSKYFFKKLIYDFDPQGYWHTDSRNALSQCLGFEDWDTYLDSLNHDGLPLGKISTAQPLAASTGAIPGRGQTNWWWGGLVVVIGGLLGVALWPRPATPLPKNPEITRIQQAIDSANQTEFDLYASVPRPDTSRLNRWFTRTGTARAMIVGGLSS